MKTTVTLFTLVFLSTLSRAGYTTPNSGVQWSLDSLVVNSGGTLTGTFPSYLLNDTVTISANDKLTIRAGSIISVSQGAGKGFTVLGVLRAIGALTDSIIIKGSVDSAGWHRGFRFEDSSVDSLCLISYCRIMNAVEGVYCLNSNPTITNTLFTRNSSNGVRCFGANPMVRNCAFIENRQSAITANVNSSPLIENNFFIRNNSQNTGARNAIAIGGQGTNNPIIRGNEISNQNYFRAGGISLVTLTSTDVCNAVVENNFIHDNSFGIVVQGLSAGGTLRSIIRYNRIENNRINSDPLVSGSGITVQTGGPSNAPIITGNTLRNNYWGITIVSSSGLASSPRPNIGDLSNADTSDDGWNIFDNNNNGGIIYQLYNNGTQDISAQNNYWGTSDSATVERWIVHRPDSAVFGRVNYTPFGCKGLGIPDTFLIQQIGGGVLRIRVRWSFPCPATANDTVRFEYSRDSIAFFPLIRFPAVPNSVDFNVPIDGGFLRLSTSNRFGTSSQTRRFALITPSVRELPGTPSDFALKQNYPNPFNPSTSIRFSIPEVRFVLLHVFDVVGREVETVVSERLERGEYQVEFDSKNLASGVYYYRLEAGDFVSTKKLILLR